MKRSILKLLKKYELYLFLFPLFILINSCDERNISLTDDSVINNEYLQKSFSLNLNKSILPLSPKYLNQDLSSRVYIGSVDDDLTSYAIFEIKSSDLINKYGFCDNSVLIDSIEEIEKVLFRLVFESPISGIYENQIINNIQTQYLDESIDSVNMLAYGNFITSYYSINPNIVFNENNEDNHTADYIEDNVNLIKNEENIIPSSNYTDYKLDLDLSNYITDINSLCNQSIEKIYILIEYSPPSYIDFQKKYEIISSDHFYMDFHPSLFLEYKQDSTIDSLVNKYDINTITYEADNMTDVILLDDSALLDLSDLDINEEDESILWDLNNLVIANVDESSNAFGTFLGYRSGTFLNENAPIVPVTDSLNLFEVTIDLNDDIISDSIIFYFSDITFGYQSVNNLYDIGEQFEDYGIDHCPDSLETGDSVDLCALTSNESIYKPDGTENNGLYDEGEIWHDLGLDWLQGTSFYGVHDNYETGCKNPAYKYGIGYENNETTETYAQIISALGGIDFYKQYFVLNDGTQIEVCGQQFWSDPLPDEQVSSCPTCNLNDPNGDNLNIDPSNDDWEDVEGSLVGDYNGNGIWDLDEPVENNGQWDWEDVDGNGIFTLDIDLYEPFFDFGVDQLPDNLESGDIVYDNYSSTNLEGTENNNNYDLGEIYYDIGFDNTSSVQENYYNRYGREGNGLVDIIDEDSSIKEYSDFGVDQCQNGFELSNNECGIEENDNGDEHFDDINIDPNNDNYNSDNLEGTENNNLWDYVDVNENDEWDAGEEFEGFDELQTPLNAIYLVGENLYNADIINNEPIQVYSKPLSLGVEDVILWISKIEKINDEYKLSISISSSVDINAFQFKLNHIPYQYSIPYLETNTTQMYPLDFEDLNNNNTPDDGELNTELKYISELSLYPIPYESPDLFSNEIILSYGYGTQWNLYFDNLNEFIYSNDQSLFIAEQQTNLIIHFDIESELHDISEEGVGLNFSGTIGDDILIEDYIPSQLIFDDTSEISIQIGSLINKLLSESDNIFQDQLEIIDGIFSHMELSLSHYSNNFSKVALDTNTLPYINILYSE